MNKFKFFSFVLLATTFAKAQDYDLVNKTIDAEKFEKAKSMLKLIAQQKPDNGKTDFLLGNVYLKQNILDSAAICFRKGLEAKDNALINNIGLGQIDLENNNLEAAKVKFATVTKELRKRDYEEHVFIAEAYMSSAHPDYKSAVEILEKVKLTNPSNAEVLLALGDAYFGEGNQNAAYTEYRDAFQADNSLIRAKMQLGVLLKGAKAYTEAVRAYDEVIAMNSNYGPVYRELAETYYLWGKNLPTTYNENIKKALEFYEKYMSLTDYSLSSRMRHADFLILAKDYKALEVEADKMKGLNNVNPRVLRYLGYAAFENGNNDVAMKSLQEYIGNPKNKVIALDYLYLAKTKLKKGISEDGKFVDANLLNDAVADINKGVTIDKEIANDLNELGKKLYEQKLFGAAASVFEIAVTNPESKNFLLDNFYLGNAIYYNNTFQGAKLNKEMLQKADTAFGNVILASPSTQDAYIFRARTNKLIENDEMMAKYYQEYMDVVTEKGEEEVAKNKSKFIEAYNNMAAHYANFDKVKAIELLNKTLLLDPANKYALDSLKLLK